MKYYGSRFCQDCGKLFEVATPDDRLCAACERPALPAEPAAVTVAPAPAPVAAEPRRDTRKRGPRPRRAAAGKNSGPVAGQRTLPMLRALADAPAGLTTPQLAALASSASSWINALGTVRQLMLKQQRQGRVVQAGTVAGNRTRDHVLWRITEAGRQYVKDAAAREVPDRYPGPLTELVALVLGMIGCPATTAQVHEYVEELSEPFTPAQVKAALFWAASRKNPTVGKAGEGRWRVTERWEAWLARECGEYDESRPWPVQAAGQDDSNGTVRAYVSRQWADAWDSPEDSVYDGK